MDTATRQVSRRRTGSTKIGIKETALQVQVRSVGGRWNKQQQAWLVPYGCIAGTKLEKLIAVETTADVKKMKSL